MIAWVVCTVKPNILHEKTLLADREMKTLWSGTVDFVCFTFKGNKITLIIIVKSIIVIP